MIENEVYESTGTLDSESSDEWQSQLLRADTLHPIFKLTNRLFLVTFSHQTLVRLLDCQLILFSRDIVVEAQEQLWLDALPVVTNDFY